MISHPKAKKRSVCKRLMLVFMVHAGAENLRDTVHKARTLGLLSRRGQDKCAQMTPIDKTFPSSENIATRRGKSAFLIFSRLSHFTFRKFYLILGFQGAFSPNGWFHSLSKWPSFTKTNNSSQITCCSKNSNKRCIYNAFCFGNSLSAVVISVSPGLYLNSRAFSSYLEDWDFRWG